MILTVAACQTAESAALSPVEPSPIIADHSTALPEKHPTFTPSATRKNTPCFESSGKVINTDIPTDLLKIPVNVNIYLPPCYQYQPDRLYPVLFMLHGQAAANDQWINDGLTTEADRLIREELIQPMLIVMPYEENWRTGPEESNYGNALLQDVIPYIEDHYRVCSEQDCRAIGGLSRGGNWAVNLGFAYPDVFTAIGAHSSPLFYGEIGRMEREIARLSSITKLPDIYIDMGKKDEQQQQIIEFVEFLKDNRIGYEFHQNEGRHENEYWSAHAADYLLWYSSQFTGTTLEKKPTVKISAQRKH